MALEQHVEMKWIEIDLKKMEMGCVVVLRK
jgi:hypothetical protein